jgi:hydroxymethylpyrimidine/phosphomethylpyrimidine kinase
MTIDGEASLRAAARAIAAGGAAVVIKGGHRPAEAIDLFFDGEQFLEFGQGRLPGKPVRGTGCIYSAAVTAGIAKGFGLEEACRLGREFVEDAIASAITIGRGSPVAAIGPGRARPGLGAGG